MRIDARKAIENVMDRSRSMYPEKDHPSWQQGVLVPPLKPRFTFRRGDTVFTIGSCFARNIERQLADFVVPTLRVWIPPEERFDETHEPNAVINEYNPGTMLQRIAGAFCDAQRPDEATIVPHKSGFIDLLLNLAKPASRERVLERRREVDGIYETLPHAKVVIITLGFIECWYDTASALFLNQMPPLPVQKAYPGRFIFRQLDVFEAYPLLERALGILDAHGIRTLLTVSPVPIIRTFSGQHVAVANAFSKSVLRVCAERLCRKFRNVDYFPSYEMVTLGGISSYIADAVHVRDDVVAAVTRHMIENYVEAA